VKKNRKGCLRKLIYFKQVTLSRYLKWFIWLCISRTTFIHDVSIATFVFNGLFCWLLPFLIKIPEGNKEVREGLILRQATQRNCISNHSGRIKAYNAESARNSCICWVDSFAINACWIRVHICNAEEVLIQKGVCHNADVRDLAPNIESRNCTSKGISVNF